MPGQRIANMNPDHVVLVTAGASGIGRNIAESFLAHACRVHVCDIDTGAIKLFLRDNPEATATAADVADIDDVQQLFQDIETQYGRLDVLVNNAGISGPTAMLEDIEPEDWKQTIDVDLNGNFYCSRAAIPLLKKAGGSIVNIASNVVFTGCPGRAPYAASKWATIGLTKTLAMELGKYGIRVNAICPCSVEGERIDRVIERDARRLAKPADEVRASYQRQSSLRQFVTADDVANLALFLASDLGRSVSGQAIGVDGHTETLRSALED